MTRIRSVLFLIWFYLCVAIVGLAGLPWFLTGVRQAGAVIDVWAACVMAGVRVLLGIRIEVRGRELVPDGPLIIASKHQGMLETIAPFLFVRRPSFVLKRELLKMPIFGWYCARGGMLIVDREAHMAAIKKMVKDAREVIAQGRPILIFPEGTRQPVGAPPDYKPGVAALYSQLGLPVVPMALNTGLVWPDTGIWRKPGVAVFQFLPVIPAGLKRDAFMAELETRIETATAALVAEGRRP